MELVLDERHCKNCQNLTYEQIWYTWICGVWFVVFFFFYLKSSEYNMSLDMKKGVFIDITRELVRNK